MCIRCLVLAGFLVGSCACLAEDGTSSEPAATFRSDDAKKAEAAFLEAFKAAETRYGTDLAAVLPTLKKKVDAATDNLTRTALQKEVDQITQELVRLHAEITGRGEADVPKDIKTDAAKKAVAEYQAAVKGARSRYIQDLMAARRVVLARKMASTDPAIKEACQSEAEAIDGALAAQRGGGTTKPPPPSTMNEIVVEAFIDGDSELWVKADGIFWHKGTWNRPGEHDGKTEPTMVNGKPWIPQWDSPDQSRLYPLVIGKVNGKLEFSLELIAVGSSMGCKGIEERDPLSTSVHSDAFVVKIPDGQPGAKWYRFRLWRAAEKPAKTARPGAKDKP